MDTPCSMLSTRCCSGAARLTKFGWTRPISRLLCRASSCRTEAWRGARGNFAGLTFERAQHFEVCHRTYQVKENDKMKRWKDEKMPVDIKIRSVRTAIRIRVESRCPCEHLPLPSFNDHLFIFSSFLLSISLNLMMMMMTICITTEKWQLSFSVTKR